MRDVALPAAMTLMMVGLMLGSQPPKTALPAALAAAGLVVLCSLGALPLSADAGIFACCSATALLSFAVYWPRLLPQRAVVVVALAGAVVAGLGLGVAPNPARSYPALFGLMTAVPALIAERYNFGIAARVVASWLIAVAVLAAVLPYVIAHPGYVPDHRG